MGWSSIGTLSPSYDWQAFDTAIFDTNLFRISQAYSGENPGKLLIRNLFASAGSAEIKVIFPDPEPLLLEFPLSPEIRVLTGAARYIQIKMPVSSRVYADTNWQVTIEQWL